MNAIKMYRMRPEEVPAIQYKGTMDEAHSIEDMFPHLHIRRVHRDRTGTGNFVLEVYWRKSDGNHYRTVYAGDFIVDHCENGRVMFLVISEKEFHRMYREVV
jgi:hypothetical protein